MSRTTTALERPRTRRPTTVAVRTAFIAGVLLLLELLARGGNIEPLVMPPPTEIAVDVWRTLGTSQFYSDLGRTAIEVSVACGVGIGCGLVVGTVFWRFPIVGRALEPYASTFYALPTVVFYPILLALMGLGSGPIIVLAGAMVTVPVALNTMTALQGLSPVLEKMARSVGCSTLQMYGKVLFPAALPVVAPGIQIGATYGVVATVVMEFVIADRGLGFRIGYNYNNFAILPMWSMMVLVILLALGFVKVLALSTDRLAKATR